MADVAIASFHLVDVGRRHAVGGLGRIGLDRRELAHTPGLLHARSLGAGHDGRMALSFRPDRRALFAVWRDDAALDRFLAESEVASRWRSAESVWSVRLRLIDGHGCWSGAAVLDGLEPATGAHGSVVTLTRAAIRPLALPSFLRHSRSVTRSLDGVGGLRAVVGVGEVPVVRLGTVAVWDDDESARRAVVEWGDHAAAMRAAAAERMFTESLFARFEPYGATGAWAATTPGPSNA
ncbi:MAG: hypothetical protein KDB37_10185 [Ilumatobacter sp.]|nr:hypothetical protein [Ilumatobacter sp.]